MTIDQSFMTNLKIYLQQSPIDSKISPTKIYKHTKQATLVNTIYHKYESTRSNSHVIYTKQAIKFFGDFSIFMVFEFLNTLKNRTRKVRSIKQVQNRTCKRNML